MMGRIDDDFIPKYAVTMWSNETDVFVALPMTAGGVPYITKFPLNEGGITQALSILKQRRREVITPTVENPANYTMPINQPQVKLSKAQERLRSETTESQRENARKVLAKLGLK